MDVDKLKVDVQTVRDLYIVADHTRTVMIAIEDGSLPSNTGGAANLRNVLRRVFHLLARHKWWEKARSLSLSLCLSVSVSRAGCLIRRSWAWTG
jgi:alanyl-tRNA synthetase